jgi:hypothetical protein
MSTSLKKHYSRLLGLTVAGLVLYQNTCLGVEPCLPSPTTDAQCLECHQPVVDRAMSKPEVHQPFREKKCMHCHLGGELFVPSATFFRVDKNIAWLAESPAPSVEHWLTIPKEQVIGDIFVDIMVPEHGVYRSVINIGYDALPELDLDKTPPVLSDVKLTSLERGIMLSATVSWLTDELADTKIVYGSEKLDSTIYIAEMSRSHRIIISGLMPATEYRFQVASADYFGNLAESDIVTFSTSDPGEPTKQESATAVDQKMTWDRKVYQNSPAGLIILQITTSEPTKVAAGVARQASPRKARRRKDHPLPWPTSGNLAGIS